MTSIPSKYDGVCKVCKREIKIGDTVHAIKQEGTDKARWCSDANCGPLQQPNVAKPTEPEQEQKQLTDQQRANLQQHYADMAAKTAGELSTAESQMLAGQVRKLFAMSNVIKSTLVGLGVSDPNPAAVGMYLKLALDLQPTKQQEAAAI